MELNESPTITELSPTVSVAHISKTDLLLLPLDVTVIAAAAAVVVAAVIVGVFCKFV